MRMFLRYQTFGQVLEERGRGRGDRRVTQSSGMEVKYAVRDRNLSRTSRIKRPLLAFSFHGTYQVLLG